jgi:hypothetical protein
MSAGGDSLGRWKYYSVRRSVLVRTVHGPCPICRVCALYYPAADRRRISETGIVVDQFLF